MSLLTETLREFPKTMRPRRVRSFRDFAEQEIILPKGPFKDLPFRVDRMPFVGLILDAFDAGGYRRFRGTGPTQTSKTLTFMQIPCLYHLFEMQEDVILGAPTTELAQSIYEERIKPVIEKTRYRGLLPTKGLGSRGGRADAITFRHGVTLRFMGGGGGDEQRSSHTARVVILTEIDKMDTSGDVSREADPVTQIEARTDAFGEAARSYAECTMSTEEGRIYQDIVVHGTHHRVMIPCLHCGEYQWPDRENFVGYQVADDEIQAREEAGYACSGCGVEWTEEERAEAHNAPLLVGEGQAVEDGRVTGGPRPSMTWGVRWNSMHSSLRTMATIAESEYKAEVSEDPSAMKRLMQFVWAEPYNEELSERLAGLSKDGITRRVSKYVRGEVPDGSRITAMIDVGLYRCWWAAVAWVNRDDILSGFVIDYGVADVPQMRGEADPKKILPTLREIREEVFDPGWQGASPGIVLVDSGYQPEIVYEFCSASGAEYRPTKGQGSAKNQDRWSPSKKVRERDAHYFISRVGRVRLINIHSDHYKRKVHVGFSTKATEDGALVLYNADRRDHNQFARHILAEREEEEFKPGKGVRVFWNVVSRKNHWLDCMAGCVCGHELLGRLKKSSTGACHKERRTQKSRYRSGRGPGYKIGR